MKKRLVTFFATSCFFLSALSFAQATSLYVDAAPNMYGSPDYADWWTSAKKSVVNESFVNMANSSNLLNSGTRKFEMEDAVVYSFGDLGSRLQFIYWVPEETIQTLTKDKFKVTIDYKWDGHKYNYYKEEYGKKWIMPTLWEEYEGGVIGTAGFAWWGAYGVDTQDALDTDIADWDMYQGNVIFKVKRKGWKKERIVARHTPSDPVPEPATALLFGAGVAGLAGVSRLRKKEN